ncbi:histidine kinase [Dokdonia sinensis]|uniref:Histidine kinase n=1 Tax=Dokdonia sinensis TaxID=2479847 RepID=A0A3M0FVV8_9FLAO|nr:2TM domain-containing protein [Dokdonia sinensis]RMB56087.1 histidine kinase [Dokdonia sinensis]
MKDKETKYARARKRVKEIKGFYLHLTIYCVVSILLQLFYAGVFDDGSYSYMPFWARFISPAAWGTALLMHGLWIFKGSRFKNIFKDWEDRKIKEVLERQERERKQWE